MSFLNGLDGLHEPGDVLCPRLAHLAELILPASFPAAFSDLVHRSSVLVADELSYQDEQHELVRRLLELLPRISDLLRFVRIVHVARSEPWARAHRRSSRYHAVHR